MTVENDLLGRPAHAFLNAVAAREATPGGGSVAAAAGALAVALARMVTAYSAAKVSGAEDTDPVRQDADRLAHADRMLRQLVNEDAAAYRAYTTARKSGEPAELARARAVAIAVPLEVAAVAGAALGIMDQFKELSNRNLISDLGVAAVLTEACVRAAAYNVRVNLRDAPQADPKGEVPHELERLLERARQARDSVVGFVDRHL
ncbi:MAG: cyclodeaminase/cyclohydrolase family protein [Planctomycetota bacterium]